MGNVIDLAKFSGVEVNGDANITQREIDLENGLKDK